MLLIVPIASSSECTVEVKTLPGTFVKGKGVSTYVGGEGWARLRVLDGDTLLFKHVGYRDTSVIVRCDLETLEVELEESVAEVSPVVVEGVIGEAVKTRISRVLVKEEVFSKPIPFSRPEDLLAGVPGVVFVGKDPTASVPAVRGLARFRTLVSLETFPLTSEREIGASLFFAPPQVIRAVEVAEGGGVMLGSGAIGGAVLYVLKGLGERNAYSVGLSDNPVAYSFFTGFSPGDSLYVAVATSKELGYRFPDTSLSGGLWGVGGIETEAGSGKFSSLINLRKWGLDFKAAFFSVRDFRRAYVGKAYYPQMHHIFLTVRRETFFAGYHGYTVILEKGNVSNLRNGRDFYSRLQRDIRFGVFRVYGGLSYLLRAGVNSVVFENGRLSYTEIEDGYSHDVGLFLFGNTEGFPLTVSYGVRSGFYKVEGGGGFNVAPAFLIGVSYGWRGFVVGLGFESSYRFPTLTESMSYSPRPRGFIVGNPELRAERGFGWNSFIGFEREGFSVDANLFTLLIRDYIELSQEGDTLFSYVNLPGHTLVRGLELEVDLERGLFSGEVSYTLIYGTYGERRLFGIPPPSANFSFTYGLFYLLGEYRFGTRGVAPGEVEREGHLLLSLGTSFDFMGMDVVMGVRNILNSVVYRTSDPKSLPMPGRGFHLSLQRSF